MVVFCAHWMHKVLRNNDRTVTWMVGYIALCLRGSELQGQRNIRGRNDWTGEGSIPCVQRLSCQGMRDKCVHKFLRLNYGNAEPTVEE